MKDPCRTDLPAPESGADSLRSGQPETGYTIRPSTASFRTPTDVTAFLANNPTEIKSAC
ncbi:hypothetical protein GTY41_07845 [Streptomyces sp. SID685]|nr:hypothetical protein [Streptomyces sp. SID685]